MSHFYVKPFLLDSARGWLSNAEHWQRYHHEHESLLHELQISSGKVVTMTLPEEMHALLGSTGYGLVFEQMAPATLIASITVYSDIKLDLQTLLSTSLLSGQGWHLVCCVCSDGQYARFIQRIRGVARLDKGIAVLAVICRAELRVHVMTTDGGSLYQQMVALIELYRRQDWPQTPLMERDLCFVSVSLYQVIMEQCVLGYGMLPPQLGQCLEYRFPLTGFWARRVDATAD